MHDDTEKVTRTEENAAAEQMNLLSFMAGAVAHEIGNPRNSPGLHLQLHDNLPELDADGS